jgi:hypothetical protein
LTHEGQSRCANKKDYPAYDNTPVRLLIYGLTGLSGNFHTQVDWVDISSVPEPSTMLLLGSGLIGLAGYGKKKFFKK